MALSTLALINKPNLLSRMGIFWTWLAVPVIPWDRLVGTITGDGNDQSC